MVRKIPTSPWREIIVAAFLAPMFSACGAGVVQVPVPSPDSAAARLCAGLQSRLPDTLNRQERRETRPSSVLVAAWGSPAIALRCGVGRPAGLRPTAELTVINDLSWLPEPAGRPVTFTALGRQAYVEVTVPAEYAPAGEVLVHLASPIKSALPANPDGAL